MHTTVTVVQGGAKVVTHQRRGRVQGGQAEAGQGDQAGQAGQAGRAGRAGAESWPAEAAPGSPQKDNPGH